jgi:tetratricopeptide (TPR) repeat protein
MRTVATAACALALGLFSGGALFAAPPSQGDKDAARALADKGAELYEAGKYEEAIAQFRRADEIVHAPTFVLAMAQASAKVGKLIEARAHYQRVVDEPLAANAPASFVDAKLSATKELEELKRRIPTLQIVVTGAPPGEIKATIDGAAVPSLDQAIEQNPGDHTVVVAPSRGKPMTVAVTLREGATERLEIAIAPDPSDRGGGSSSSNTNTKGSIVPALIGFGVGGLGFGIGAVTGALALGKVSDIKATCSDNVCPRSQEAEASSAGTLADVSTVGFVIGGVGVAAGVVLLIVRPGGGGGSADKPAEQATVRASFGFGSVHVSGTF